MLTIAAENAEQARAWDGPEGEHWTVHEDRYDAALQAYRSRFREAAAIRSHDVVLDVGCGTGQTTRDAARVAIAGSATGIDLSARMIERATERAAAEGLTNATFRQGDAQIYPFAEAGFDAVISRTGAMFFGDRTAAFTNLARALRPGGRLTLLAWQSMARNEWLTVVRDCLAAGRDLPAPPPEAPSPFGLSEPALVESWLTAAGFGDIRFAAVDAPFHAGADADDAAAFLAGTGAAQGLLGGLDEAARRAALGELRAAMAAHETPEGVRLGSRAWLITAVR
jgi:SAM-dependent methyltransferase